MRVAEEDYLMLSGIQHFSFCRRQWALIHIEQLWDENVRTLEGQHLHEKAHDETVSEKRGDLILSRGMAVSSAALGCSGVCDVVELRKDVNGIAIFGRDGLYQPVPVEYKRGSPKATDADLLQLCAQALCLEEMLVCEIPYGYLYYNEVRRRTKVELNQAMRNQVQSMFAEMHQHYQKGYTPKVRPTKSCKACSLIDYCLPKLGKNKSARGYIETTISLKTADSPETGT